MCYLKLIFFFYVYKYIDYVSEYDYFFSRGDVFSSYLIIFKRSFLKPLVPYYNLIGESHVNNTDLKMCLVKTRFYSSKLAGPNPRYINTEDSV